MFRVKETHKWPSFCKENSELVFEIRKIDRFSFLEYIFFDGIKYDLGSKLVTKAQIAINPLKFPKQPLNISNDDHRLWFAQSLIFKNKILNEIIYH